MEHVRTDPDREQIRKHFQAGRDEGEFLLAMTDTADRTALEVYVAERFVREREAGNVDFRMSHAQGMWNAVGSLPLTVTLNQHAIKQGVAQ